MPTEAQFRGANQEELRKLIERRHPTYVQNIDHWRFLEQTYDGGPEWFKANIHKYLKEGAREFKDRVKRAYRPNHTREVVDIVNKYVFKGEILRSEDAEKCVKDFWKAATLDKRPIADLVEGASRRASIFGRTWVVVDNNSTDGIVSKADEKASNVRTYAYTVKPENALDWAYDDDGELEWIKLRELRRAANDPLTSSGAMEVFYRIWGKDYWVLIREEANDRGEGKIYSVQEYRTHNLGIVPVFSHEHIYTDDRDETPALIADVAYLDKAVANYLSNIDAIIQDQTFSQLTIPSQSMLPGSDEYKQMVEMGTKRIFVYNGEGSGGPEYISPDPRQAALIMSVIEKLISEIYHSVGMAGERTKQDNSQSIDNSSGVAKAYDFEKLNSLLAAKARGIELAERNLIRLVRAWNGSAQELQDQPDYVTYPSSFDIRSFSDELDTATKFFNMEAPAEVRKEQMRRLVDKLWPKLKTDIRDAIFAEIKTEWPLSAIDLIAATAAARPTLGSKPVADTSKPPVPGKKNRQGENTKA